MLIDLTGPAAAARERLRLIARTAEALALGGMVTVVGYAVFLLVEPEAMLRALSREVVDDIVDPGGLAVGIAWFLSLVPAIMFVTAMWWVRDLFRLLRRAPLFHPDAPPLMRRIGLLALAGTVAGILTHTLVAAVLTVANPPGHQHLVISLSSSDVIALIVGLLLLAFAQVMREGQRLDEDSRSIV
jgi:hypothetical protein